MPSVPTLDGISPAQPLAHHVQVDLVLERVLQPHHPRIVRSRQHVALRLHVPHLLAVRAAPHATKDIRRRRGRRGWGVEDREAYSFAACL